MSLHELGYRSLSLGHVESLFSVVFCCPASEFGRDLHSCIATYVMASDAKGGRFIASELTTNGREMFGNAPQLRLGIGLFRVVGALLVGMSGGAAIGRLPPDWGHSGKA